MGLGWEASSLQQMHTRSAGSIQDPDPGAGRPAVDPAWRTAAKGAHPIMPLSHPGQAPLTMGGGGGGYQSSWSLNPRNGSSSRPGRDEDEGRSAWRRLTRWLQVGGWGGWGASHDSLDTRSSPTNHPWWVEWLGWAGSMGRTCGSQNAWPV